MEYGQSLPTRRRSRVVNTQQRSSCWIRSTFCFGPCKTSENTAIYKNLSGKVNKDTCRSLTTGINIVNFWPWFALDSDSNKFYKSNSWCFLLEKFQQKGVGPRRHSWVQEAPIQEIGCHHGKKYWRHIGKKYYCHLGRKYCSHLG